MSEPSALGDRLWLVNGDVLSAKLILLQGGYALVRSPYLGELSVPWEMVKTFETKEAFIRIGLNNGDLISAWVISATDHGVVLRSPQKEGVFVPTQSIIALMRDLGTPAGTEIKSASGVLSAAAGPVPQEPGKPTTKAKKPEEKMWAGSVSLQGAGKTGNRDSISAFLNVEARRNTPRNQLTLRSEAGYGETEGVVDTTQGRIQANERVYYTESAYVLGDMLFEHDRFKDLDLRADGTLGAGIRFWKTELSEFLGDVGFGVSHEIHRNDGTDTNPTVRIGMEYMRRIFAKSKLSQVLTVYPSVGSLSKVRLNSQTTFETPLWDFLSWNFSIVDEYDSQTAKPGVNNNDLSVRTGLSYKF